MANNLTGQIFGDSEFKFFLTKAVRKHFNSAKNAALREFNYHPVTNEIEKGSGDPNFANISGTLGGLGGANLFNFIGFESSDSPTQIIRGMLEKSHYGILGDSVTFYVPTAEEIFEVTPLPWPGSTERSWVKGIESGLSGLNYFLRKFHENSRSGFGIQSKYQVRSGFRYKPVPYISRIINNFNTNLRNFKL